VASPLQCRPFRFIGLWLRSEAYGNDWVRCVSIEEPVSPGNVGGWMHAVVRIISAGCCMIMVTKFD
jgi:hypothetical protein